MASEAELLARHAPLLRYDPQDLYRAISAEAAVTNAGNLLVDGDGEVIAAAPIRPDGSTAVNAGAEPLLSLELLAAHGDREDVAAERIAYAPGYQSAARRMQRQGQALAGRIHGRVIPAEDGERWLQYWFFYYYNPKNLGGLGKHEGDWEMIQILLGADERPVRATYAQHEFGRRAEWADLESVDGHPVVYVGQLSHASYFGRGSFPYAVVSAALPLGVDHALGGCNPGGPDGPSEIPVVDPLPEAGWATWPGRWGSGERAITLIAPQGDGPPSPGRQEPKWSDPGAFDRRQGLVREVVRRAISAAIRLFGRLTYPKPVELHAAGRRDDGTVEVSFSTQNSLLRRSRHVLITVNQADGPQLVLRSRALTKPPRPAQMAFRLAANEQGPLRVWASAFNGPRQRGDPVAIDVGPMSGSRT